MQIVNMAFMPYCRMPTIGTVLVRMIRMMILIASGHCDFHFFLAGRRRLRRFGSMLHGAFHQTKDVSVGKRIVDVLCLAPSFDQSHVVQRLKTSQNSRQLFAFSSANSVLRPQSGRMMVSGAASVLHRIPSFQRSMEDVGAGRKIKCGNSRRLRQRQIARDAIIPFESRRPEIPGFKAHPG